MEGWVDEGGGGIQTVGRCVTMERVDEGGRDTDGREMCYHGAGLLQNA